MYKYDPQSGVTYIPGVHALIPSHAIDLKKSTYLEVIAAPQSGKVRRHHKDGTPYLEDAPLIEKGVLLNAAKNNIRAVRLKMLDALTGIAGRAVRAGNDALAEEADSLAEQLLDITDDPALNAATTYEEMQAAGVAAYKRIAATACPELSIVFKEITGA